MQSLINRQNISFVLLIFNFLLQHSSFLRQHRGKVTGLCYCPSGEYLYSSGSLGSLAIYDASDNHYQLLRLLGNTLARGDGHGPEALAISPDGRFVAFVGPSEFTVSVVDGRSLDEVCLIYDFDKNLFLLLCYLLL